MKSVKLPSNKVIDAIMCDIEGATLAQIIEQIEAFNPLASREQIRKKILDYTSHKLHTDKALQAYEIMRWYPVPPPGEELVGETPIFEFDQTTDEITINPNAPRATYWLFDHLEPDQLDRVEAGADRDMDRRNRRHRLKKGGFHLRRQKII
jgi:hypothetical protein